MDDDTCQHALTLNSKPIVVIGGGGHARVVIDTLIAGGAEVLGFVDQDPSKDEVLGLYRLGNVEHINTTFKPAEVNLANGIGTVGAPGARQVLFDRFTQQGYAFLTCIHPGAIVSPHAQLKQGVQIMAGAVVQPGAVLGENTLVNTGAKVDHDCRIGAHVHIAPGAILSGDVHIGDCSHIGTGAAIIQGIKMGSNCIVGAGSVVVKDVVKGDTVLGVPATSRRRLL